MSIVFESCIKALPQGCIGCVFNDHCEEKELYEKGRSDKYQEIISEYMLLTEKQVAEIKTDAIEDFSQLIKYGIRHNTFDSRNSMIEWIDDLVADELKEQNNERNRCN